MLSAGYLLLLIAIKSSLNLSVVLGLVALTGLVSVIQVVAGHLGTRVPVLITDIPRNFFYCNLYRRLQYSPAALLSLMLAFFFLSFVAHDNSLSLFDTRLSFIQTSSQSFSVSMCAVLSLSSLATQLLAYLTAEAYVSTSGMMLDEADMSSMQATMTVPASSMTAVNAAAGSGNSSGTSSGSRVNVQSHSHQHHHHTRSAHTTTITTNNSINSNNINNKRTPDTSIGSGTVTLLHADDDEYDDNDNVIDNSNVGVSVNPPPGRQKYTSISERA